MSKPFEWGTRGSVYDPKTGWTGRPVSKGNGTYTQRYFNKNTGNYEEIEYNDGSGQNPGESNIGYSVADVAAGVNAAAGLADAYVGYKNYGLAKDANAFYEASTNRNLQNQGLAYNTVVKQNNDVAATVGGLTSGQRQQLQDYSKANEYMNVSKIG